MTRQEYLNHIQQRKQYRMENQESEVIEYPELEDDLESLSERGDTVSKEHVILLLKELPQILENHDLKTDESFIEEVIEELDELEPFSGYEYYQKLLRSDNEEFEGNFIMAVVSRPSENDWDVFFDLDYPHDDFLDGNLDDEW